MTNPWEKEFVECPLCSVRRLRESEHECNKCDNCGEIVDWHQQRNTHFVWERNIFPVYTYQKRTDEEKEIAWRKYREKIFRREPISGKYKFGCIICDAAKLREKNMLKAWVSDNKNILAMVELRPNSKGHCTLITKRHIKGIREMTMEEWNDMLPVLKDVIRKIQRVYSPVGYRLSISIGKLGNQNVEHCYIRILPKYKKGYGAMGISQHYNPATPEQVEKIKKALQPNSEGTYGEKSKVVAKIRNDINFAYTQITAKQHLSNSIDSFLQLDLEFWTELGELFQECLRNLKNKLAADNFQCSINLGKFAAVDDKEANEIRLTIFPKYNRTSRTTSGGQFVGSMDNERVAEKLRGPEAYAKKWGPKKHPSVRKLWQQRERERKREKLKFEIKELEELPNKSPQQEQELENKRAELARLETQINAEKQFNWTPLIGLGIVFTVIVGISLLIKGKEKLKKSKKKS